MVFTSNNNVLIEKIGYPGSEVNFSIVPISDRGKIEINKAIADRSKREIRFNCILGKDIINESSIDLSFDAVGDSLLVFPNHLEKFKVEMYRGSFTIKKNRHNRASNILFSCITTSIKEAEDIFNESIIPFIDYMSFEYNIPIYVDRVMGWDLKNNFYFTSISVPHTYTLFKQTEFIFSYKMKPIFALFREAKASNSYYYKFLCYYKT